MAAQPNPTLSEQEYLDLERAAEFRSEYWFGTVLAMAGGSERHSLISVSLSSELRQHLKHRGCRVYSSDMRLGISPNGLYFYPDVMAVCGEPAFADARRDVLLNPSVIVEVLSPSTETYDREKKSWHYRRLESVRELVLVSQESPVIECYHRTSNQEWLLRTMEGMDASLRLDSLDLAIPFAEIYANVVFDSPIMTS